LRQRYKNEGLDNFQPHEVLELLLMYAIPRKDTNGIGHALIEKFGSLANVFEASHEELCKVDGIGDTAAGILKLMIDVNRRYLLSKFGNSVVLDSTEKLAKYCRTLEFGRPRETLYMICFNIKKKVTATFLLEEGTLDNAAFHVSKIIEKAMGAKAYSVAVVHNHPGGAPTPSDKDIRATFMLISALKTVEIKFEDHIIIGDGEEWISMRESKYI
jgi:DNA repair protein RadC